MHKTDHKLGIAQSFLNISALQGPKQGPTSPVIISWGRLSTNRRHPARIEVLVVLRPVSPYPVTTMPLLSELVDVAFGNFTTVTIMCNEVLLVILPFKGTGPYLRKVIASFSVRRRPTKYLTWSQPVRRVNEGTPTPMAKCRIPVNEVRAAISRNPAANPHHFMDPVIRE